MKRILSVFLLLAFVTANFSQFIIVIHYELNKTQITQEYCVNKDKPMMHCCGKCHLTKKLAEDDAKQKSSTVPNLKNEILLDFPSLATTISFTVTGRKNLTSPYLSSLLPGVNGSVFHPPSV